MINQTLAQVEQSGAYQEIDINARDFDFTSAQVYFAMTAASLLIALAIYLTYRLAKSIARSTCCGCKRLGKCEKEIKNIKATMVLNDIVDVDILKEIADEVKDLKNEVTK